MSKREETLKAVQSMPYGMILVGRNHEIFFINDAASKILGETPPPPTRFDELVEKVGLDPFKLLAETGNTLFTREISIAHIPYKLMVFPLLDGDTVEAASLLLRNISQEKRVDTMKSEFISTVSHEIRTPLTSIKNALEIVLSRKAGEISPEQERFLQIADRNIIRVVNIINSYLDLAKIELGKIEFHFRSIHLQEVIRTILNDFMTRAREKGITFSRDIPDGLPEITADPQRLEQIFTNLIDNALKFTPAGGRITISAKADEALPGAAHERKFVKVIIEDTGRGIPENERERIFDKFYQVGDPHGKSKGAGLGLAIVKELIEAHGGKIEVESKPGAGSRFSFFLREAAAEKRDLHFRYFFNREFIRASKNQCHLSLILISIKNFPELRDSFGEDKINHLLEALQEALKNSLFRQADILTRYRKGEIFLVICETERYGAEVIKARIKTRIKEFSGDSLREVLEKSIIGVGLATYPSDASTQRELFRKAIKDAEEDSL